MYLLFKSVDDKVRRNVQIYGQWTLWTIGYIPPTTHLRWRTHTRGAFQPRRHEPCAHMDWLESR